MDELAIQSQQDSESFKEKLGQLELARKQEVEAMSESHQSEVSEITQVLEQEQVRCFPRVCYLDD